MCSMNISPTISMNASIKDSTMSSPSPASNQVVSKGSFENPSGWAACSISTSALPDPLPLPQPFRSSAHASRPACLHPLSLPRCVTAPWKIFNQHLSPMQPLLPRMYILTIREFGDLELATPRDRNGSFEPKIWAKGKRRFKGFDRAIISLFSGGLTTGEIEGLLREIYGVEV